jgi:hypothetical protein
LLPIELSVQRMSFSSCSAFLVGASLKVLFFPSGLSTVPPML